MAKKQPSSPIGAKSKKDAVAAGVDPAAARRRAVVVAGAAGVVLAGALALYLSRGASKGDEPAGEASEGELRAGGMKALRMQFSPNTTYSYALRYASKTKAIPAAGSPGVTLRVDGPSQTIDGDLELEGTLSLHAYPPATTDDAADRDATLLGVSLDGCAGSFRVAGQPLWPEGGCRSVFEGKELFVRVGRTGRVTAIYATEGGASLFDHLMRAIVQETQVRLPEAPGTQAWAELEPLPQGTVHSLYRLVPPADGAPVAIERTRERYDTLLAAAMIDAANVDEDESARHRVELSDDGVVGRIEGKERLEAKASGQPFVTSETELSLAATGRSVEERARPDLSRFAARALEEQPHSRALEERMLEQRAAGLSWTEAIFTLTEYGDAGPLPDHSRFLWRATALLLLDPKRAWDLVEVFEGGRPGGKLRGLVLDLLASASTPEAQSVMRKLLAGEKAKTDPRYVHLVQRMGFVSSPDKESVAFLRSRYMEATEGRRKNERYAAAYAMGSLADAAKRDHDDATSALLIEDLTSALRDARPDELVFFLNALANADSASTFGTFASYASHPDPAVREAVANALDEPQTPQALSLLLELVADGDRAVQRAALKSLRRYSLTAPVLRDLARISDEGRMFPENVRYVVDLVKTYRFVFPRDEEMLLRSLLAHPIDDDLVRAAVQQLLDAHPPS